MDLCFLDLETTGFEPKEDSIIEISFVRYKDGAKVAEYDQVIRPDKSPLNDFVSHLTGITDKEIEDVGIDLETAKTEIRELIGESAIVGHNIDFDIRFLVGNGIDVSQNPRLDTHELSRILLPLEASFALEVLSEKYGFQHQDAHRAMSDVWASKDLYEMLLEKIERLPADYLVAVTKTLKDKTDWYALNLFTAVSGPAKSEFYQKENFYTPPKNETPALDITVDLETNHSVWLGENRPSAEAFSGLANTLIDQGKEVLIVSSKLDFFKNIPKFPTPEVILDISRLEGFVKNREKLDDLETTFYLQCQLRHHMGFRGVFFFDLFFKMRGYWKEVHELSPESDNFQSIITEKSRKKVLALSPEAFFRFIDLDIFKDRVVLLDEVEIAAEKLLQAPAETLSFGDFLEKEDDQATSAQFLTHHFCRDVIETRLNHQIGPFGAKILLNESDRFPEFTESLMALLPTETQKKWTDWCTNPVAKLVRWVTYNPRSGDLSWHQWHPDAWRDLKEKLQNFTTIYGHRYPFRAEENAFWRIFYGVDELAPLELGIPHFTAELEVPMGLVSHSSPDFNQSCSQHIAEAYGNTDKNLTVNFSSLDTMRHCFDDLTKEFIDTENFAIFGEKISGGDGKMWQMVQKNTGKKSILCTQRILKPELASFDTDTLVIQKFPFAAPHPLLEKIEGVMKQSGQSWWDIWVVPQLTANLHRRVGNFSNLKKVIWLDPRENSKWGKQVLRKIFGW